jgi:alkanesulfonate monooxygenase SsuD/methylene tetrahydromethanopterin reductase-like flavin-dependent oxidoreductase (luciferase family)
MTADGIPLEYGLLLPHFGTFATRAALLDGARRIEAYGFDSVWVRDHLVYRPHDHEDSNRTHIDPLIVLAAVAAVTDRVTLGTGVLIPHRHPIHAALLLGSLDRLAPGRVIAGWGLGAFNHEFDAIGIGSWDRRELVEEHVRTIRELLSGKTISHRGKFYEFDDVDIAPTPSDAKEIPLWYGGPSPAAARRSAEYCDGYLATRTPRSDLRKRLAIIDRILADEPSRPVGVIPYVSPGKTVEAGAAFFNLPALFADTTRHYGTPPGDLSTLDDLDGAAIAGPPDVIIDQVRRYQAAGATHFVFDLRARFADWEECVALLGEEVLPELRRGDSRPATSS